MPARNWASPPNVAANGASVRPEVGIPHQPAMFEATMNVAPAKPARPKDRRRRDRLPEPAGTRETVLPRLLFDAGERGSTAFLECRRRLSSFPRILKKYRSAICLKHAGQT